MNGAAQQGQKQSAKPSQEPCRKRSGRRGQHVHLVHPGDAYLPELQAYGLHLQSLGHEAYIHTNAADVPLQADVVWWFCGRVDRQQARRLQRSRQVHEYASASVGRWPALKDTVKRLLHPRPDHRIFQSDWVRQRMGFDDGVPFSLRDMAVPASFVQARRSTEPDVDLVYLGEMRRLASFVSTLRAIGDAGLRLLLVGQVPEDLQPVLTEVPGVVLSGRVPQQEVPAQLLRARAGLNLMPAVQPLSEQTSTKALEYLAVGLPVVSNPYPWIERCALQHPGRVFTLSGHTKPIEWQVLDRQLPELDAGRRHWHGQTWAQLLPSLPVWQALELA